MVLLEKEVFWSCEIVSRSIICVIVHNMLISCWSTHSVLRTPASFVIFSITFVFIAMVSIQCTLQLKPPPEISWSQQEY